MTARANLIEQLNSIMPGMRFEIIQIVSRYEISDSVHQHGADLRFRVDSFLAAKRIDGLSSKTLLSYRDVLRTFSTKVNKPVEIISADDIRRYIAYLADERHLANTSIQTHISTLRSFFSWLTDEDIIDKTPMRKIRSLRIDRLSSRRPLTGEQLEILRDCCDGYKEKALLEFLVSTGCRLGEVVGLRVDEIDWQQRRVIVLGKGNKKREVYFSVRAKLMLEKYISMRKGGDALFSSDRFPYAPMGPRSIQKTLAKIGKRIHSSRKVHPHLLRHTFATTALNSGMDITTIQHLLGHSDLQTTLIYAEISPRKVKYEYERLIA